MSGLIDLGYFSSYRIFLIFHMTNLLQSHHIKAAPKPPERERALRKWGSLVVMSLALAIIVIDTTLLNVSLGNIIRDLNTDIQHLQWVITAYALMLSAFTITGGRMGDIFGRKRMFMLGAVIFAIGSFLASVSTSVGMLIWGEAIIEGVGAALMLPATSALLVSTFKGHERAIAFGVWGGIAAASAAIGPVLGGWMTSHWSWRWGFRINVAVTALLLIGSVIVKEARDREERPEIDWMGVVLSAVGMFLISFGIIEASTYGWWLAKAEFMIGSFAVPNLLGLSIMVPSVLLGLFFMVLFFFWIKFRERRHRTPLVSTKLFKNHRFMSGATTMAVISLGQAGIIFALPVFFQAVSGLDAFHTGLGLLPLSLSILIAAPMSAALSRRVYPKTLILTGLVLNAIAYITLIVCLQVTATPWTLAPGLFIYGLGMGLVMGQISNITLSAVSVQEAGEASGMNNTFRQIGQTLGSAMIGSILLTSISTGMTQQINQSVIIPDQAKSAIVSALASQTSQVEFGGGATFSQNIPPAIKTEITRIGHEATAFGNRSSLFAALIFSLMGFLVAMTLPKERNVERGTSVAAGGH
jgi:EmrB/QacA subfamily drug resistance transporter